MKSMWFQIRKSCVPKITQKDIAKEFNVSKQYIHRIESGELSMPNKYQIYYLSLRNSEEDKIVIEHLKELEKIKKGEF